MARRFLSVPEVAAKFEVTGQTVRNWIASGRLEALQPTSRGRFRIPADAVRTLEHTTAPIESHELEVQRDPRGGPAHGSRSLDLELGRIVAAIVASVRPQAILLFGSRARGDARPDSDFDLAIITPDGSERRRIAMQAYESVATLPNRSVGVDFVVLTPRLIATERDLAGSIVRAVTREGVPVYGHAALA